MDFPSFDEHLSDLNQFIFELVSAYNAEEIISWDDLEERVHAFFTPERMNEAESIVPGWKKMASYSDGVTLTHVMCIFLGMYMKPEYLRLTQEQQEEMKWVILFHDVEKAPQAEKRDHAHAFRSAVGAARTLPGLGFPVMTEYDSLIDGWDKFTRSSITKLENLPDDIQDNHKLPTILDGIERMFGQNTPATLIIKTILFHLSVNMDLWPPPNPLTNDEVKNYFNGELSTLLLLMNLGDNDGWALFDPEVRENQRVDIIDKFEKIEKLLSSERISKMDKEFWASIAKNGYKIPNGYMLDELTKTLFGYLGSTDPELRDDIVYMVYANWLKREVYSKDEIRDHVNQLLNNLGVGIGEIESDSVFLRTFSILLLAEIVHNDNKKPLLDKEQIQSILEKGLWYLDAEKDPRGHIPVKGWAHALAHTADLMLVLGKNRFIEKGDLEKILQGIAHKLIHSTNWVYIHGEDDRLASAVIEILKRELVTIEFLKTWLKSFTGPEKSWNGAYMDDGQAKAFHNVRNFLRSLSEAIRSSEDLSQKESIQSVVHDALDHLKPY